MRKILALFLAGVMVFSGVSVFAENSSDDEGVITQKPEIAQLYDMGIMHDVGSGPFQNITRAEMAKIVTQTLRMTDVAMLNTFTDVPDEHQYINEIGAVQSMKIMCGCGNDIFNPDSYITYYEAAKTIVSMLGYDALALQNGGYPHGYLKVANELGIILYPGADNFEIYKNDIAKMIIRAMDVPLMKQTSFGETTEYQISEETLKSRFNISEDK